MHKLYMQHICNNFCGFMKFLTKEGLAVGYSILYVRSGSEGFIDSRSQLHIVLIHTCVHTCGVGGVACMRTAHSVSGLL